MSHWPAGRVRQTFILALMAAGCTKDSPPAQPQAGSSSSLRPATINSRQATHRNSSQATRSPSNQATRSSRGIRRSSNPGMQRPLPPPTQAPAPPPLPAPPPVAQPAPPASSAPAPATFGSFDASGALAAQYMATTGDRHRRTDFGPPRSSKAKVKGIPLQVIEDPKEVNAFAGLQPKGGAFMGITAPLLLIMARLPKRERSTSSRTGQIRRAF